MQNKYRPALLPLVLVATMRQYLPGLPLARAIGDAFDGSVYVIVANVPVCCDSLQLVGMLPDGVVTPVPDFEPPEPVKDARTPIKLPRGFVLALYASAPETRLDHCAFGKRLIRAAAPS